MGRSAHASRGLEHGDAVDLVGEPGDDAVSGVELAVLLGALVEGDVGVLERKFDDLGGRLGGWRVQLGVMSRRDFGKSNDVRRDVHEAGRGGGWQGKAESQTSRARQASGGFPTRCLGAVGSGREGGRVGVGRREVSECFGFVRSGTVIA